MFLKNALDAFLFIVSVSDEEKEPKDRVRKLVKTFPEWLAKFSKLEDKAEAAIFRSFLDDITPLIEKAFASNKEEDFKRVVSYVQYAWALARSAEELEGEMKWSSMNKQ